MAFDKHGNRRHDVTKWDVLNPIDEDEESSEEEEEQKLPDEQTVSENPDSLLEVTPLQENEQADDNCTIF